MRKSFFSNLALFVVLSVAGCGTIATPEWTYPTVTPIPSPTPLPHIDPALVTTGRWQWISFDTAAETYPPVQLWIDVEDAGEVNGVLSVYPNSPDIPPAALTLIQQNGCNVAIESMSAAAVDGFFYSATQARLSVNVVECTVKFYGPVTLGEPLQGEFDVAYDAELTEMIRNPAELTPIERGRRVFATYCSACHGSYAEGLPGIPSLNTDQVRSYTDEQLLTIISNGVINTAMPAWGIVLSPEDLQGAFELVRNIEILSQ